MEEENNEIVKKTINISGTNNRYMMKKVIKEPKIIKKRQDIDNWNFPEEYFTFEKQYDILCDINKNIDHFLKMEEGDFKIIISQIERKISSYKQQDILKKKLDKNNFIDAKDIIEKMIDCKLDCYYCKNKMLLLYEIVREKKQWTIDRINNDIGHNKDNYVLACLECNLKRRRKDCDKFLFTKQLNIVKSGEK